MTPSYTSSNAIYLEESEAADSKAYFYVSFTVTLNTNYYMHIMKLDSSSLKAAWNFFYLSSTAKPIARFIWPDPLDSTQFFYGGYKSNYAFLSKMQRRDGKVLFENSFQISSTPTLTDIQGYYQPQGLSHFYGCGYESANKYAGYFRMESSGSVEFFYKITPSVSSQLYCRGITYDESQKLASLLIQTADTGIKKINNPAASVDSFILVINDQGRVRRLRQITFSQTSAQNDQTLGMNVLRRYMNYYIYAGTTEGFVTKLQKEKFGTTPALNTFLMKYLIDKDSAQGCILEDEPDVSSINSARISKLDIL